MLRLVIVFAFQIFLAAACQSSTPMKNIKGGEFLPLYSLDSQKIIVKPFNMDIYPVTNSAYKNFIIENPKWSKSKIKRLYADSNYLHQWTSDTTFNEKIANSPVVNISWFAAKKYCECQGKRLPTIAEWELVAKASKNSYDATKDAAFKQWILDWTLKASPKTLPTVGSTYKNIYGIWDIYGLVWEWTYDFNTALTTGESRDNSSLNNTFFCGGGSFSSKDNSNYASYMRFAFRSSLKANFTVPNLGFRCVK